AFPEALDEVLPVRRMQEERRSRFQSAMDGAEDAQELIVVDVLREIQRERGVEPARMLRTESDDVGAVERCVRDAECVPPALRRAHEFLGEVDADVLADVGGDELGEDAVAASEV